MKNKKLFLKIGIALIGIYIIFLISFSILGRITRVGYLSEFKFDENHINKTLELNGFNVDETRKLFIVNSILDNDALTNYIFTNKSITNYSYGCRIKYYSKIFGNSDIYGVYIDINKAIEDNNFIKEINMNAGGSPFGYIISTKKIDSEKIDVDYILKIKIKILVILIILFCLFILYIIFYLLYKYLNYKKKLSNNYYNFINILEIVMIALFFFQYCLCSPGYFQYSDTWGSMWESVWNFYSNWNPLIITLFLENLYIIFGYNVQYLLILNLILWYLGLYLIILSLYLKFKNKYVILLYLLSFLFPIFIMNINHIKDSTASLWLWFSFSAVFFITILDEKIKNYKVKLFISFIILFSLIVTMLWRHNFIVTIYPIFILLVYNIVDRREYFNIRKKILHYFLYMALAAVLLVSIYYCFPRMFISDMSYSKLATNHLFLLQIAGCAVPANDGSMIPDEWYENGKTFEDVKKMYNDNPYYADNFSTPWAKNRPFKYGIGKLNDVKKVWLKYILKYPMNYLKHIFNYAVKICTVRTWRYDLEEFNKHWIPDYFFDKFNVVKVTLNPFKKNIYDFLYKFLPDINIFIFILLSVILTLISCFLWIFKVWFRNTILLFTISTLFSSIATTIIVIFFTPSLLYRYIYPVIPITIIALIGFITFIYDRGGFKKFIKELRGDNK